MVFTNRSYDISNTIIRLANNPIERVSSFKYLGITIDDKLKYDDHIKVLCDRISRMCGISYKLKDHFNMSTAKNMYLSHRPSKSKSELPYSHTYGTRHRNDLVLPFPNVNAIRINYVYQCTSVWNNIPENIKSKETLKSFKREFSKYLVNSY